MRSLGAFAPLLVLTAFLSVSSAFYVASGTSPSRPLDQLAGMGTTWAFLAWVLGDARQRRRVPCFDFGFLVAVFLPVSLVWYVFWTRGWKGVALLTAFAGMLVVPWLCSLAAWAALWWGR